MNRVQLSVYFSDAAHLFSVITEHDSYIMSVLSVEAANSQFGLVKYISWVRSVILQKGVHFRTKNGRSTRGKKNLNLVRTVQDQAGFGFFAKAHREETSPWSTYLPYSTTVSHQQQPKRGSNISYSC